MEENTSNSELEYPYQSIRKNCMEAREDKTEQGHRTRQNILALSIVNNSTIKG